MTGLEPATPGVTGRYSNQLSYNRAMGVHYRLRPRASSGKAQLFDGGGRVSWVECEGCEMTEAEKAYQAALEEIERVKREGRKYISLTNKHFRELDRLPPELSQLSGLSSIDIRSTAIADIAPVAELYKLQGLDLSNTAVTDLSPLAKLLQLSDVILRGTAVSDLRPLSKLEQLGTRGLPGLAFTKTLATECDAELAKLSKIEDVETRSLATLAYLNTLPPWPEPYLPKARPDGKPPEWIGLRDGDRPPLSPSPIPGRGLVPPAGLRRLTLSDARALLETGHPILRDRCQRVVADIDEALALQAIRIPNDPDQLAAHEALSRTLVLCKAALMGIHDAIPEDLSDQPIDDVAAGRLRAAFDAALESLKEAARYIDRKDHTPTYGGLLRLGAATGVASIMAMAPGVTLAVALPTVYACLYGPEAAKALKEFGKLGGS